MQSYSMISHSVIDGNIFITIDKIYKPGDQNCELEPKKISVLSLPMIGFKEEDAAKLPLINGIEMTQNSEAFNGFLFSEEIAKRTGEKSVYQLRSVCYKLPTDPLLALHTITLLDSYATRTGCLYKDFNFKKYINNGRCDISLQNFFKLLNIIFLDDDNDDNPRVKYFFYDSLIDRMKNLNNYQPAICKIEDFRKFCEITEMSILQCINNTTLSSLIWKNKNPYDLVNNDLDSIQRSEIINAITNHTVNATNKWEMVAHNVTSLLNLDPTDWNEIIQDIFRQKLINLCAPCDGKKACDGTSFRMGSYNHLHSHTEVNFLVECGVNLTLKDGRICLTDLKKNAKYNDVYAVGKRLYKDFEKELTILGQYIGLEFESCNHNEIILTKESHDLLERKGFVDIIELFNHFKKSPESLVIVNKDYKEPQATVSNVKGTLYNKNLNNSDMQDVDQQPSLSNTYTFKH
jgi:hypothetical protein